MTTFIRRFAKGSVAIILMILMAYLVFLSFSGIVFKKNLKLISFLRYSSIKPGFIKFIDLNFNTLFSDYFWVLFVQESSSYRIAKMRYPYMYRISVITVSLNHRFSYGYQAGGTLLGLAGKPRRAIKLLKMGMKHINGSWNIPFLIAFNYFYNLDDFKKAAYYLKAAIRMKGSPKYLEFLYIKLLNSSGSLEKAMSFLKGIYKNNKNPYVRRAIKYKMDAIKREMQLKEEHKSYRIPYSLKLFLPPKK